MAQVAFTNQTNVITAVIDTVEYNFTKSNVRLTKTGDSIRVDDYSALVVEVDFNDVTAPTVSSAAQLLTTLRSWLQ
jgi:hypothetical protein